MKRLFGGLLMTTGAMVLAVGVLVAVEHLLSSPDRGRRKRKVVVDDAPAVSEPVAERLATAEPATVPAKPAQRNFSIKRTKSEVGFVYWILEGRGRYKCFIHCDTWEEAVAQAKARIEDVDGADMRVPVGASSAS
jgi:hypothetical protein